jgi:hypothetical protein
MEAADNEKSVGKMDLFRECRELFEASGPHFHDAWKFLGFSKHYCFDKDVDGLKYDPIRQYADFIQNRLAERLLQSCSETAEDLSLDEVLPLGDTNSFDLPLFTQPEDEIPSPDIPSKTEIIETFARFRWLWQTLASDLTMLVRRKEVLREIGPEEAEGYERVLAYWALSVNCSHAVKESLWQRKYGMSYPEAKKVWQWLAAKVDVPFGTWQEKNFSLSEVEVHIEGYLGKLNDLQIAALGNAIEQQKGSAANSEQISQSESSQHGAGDEVEQLPLYSRHPWYRPFLPPVYVRIAWELEGHPYGLSSKILKEALHRKLDSTEGKDILYPKARADFWSQPSAYKSKAKQKGGELWEWWKNWIEHSKKCFKLKDED